MATFGATAKTWPEGKAVKISFHQTDNANGIKTVMWKPERRYFHEVIMNLASGNVIQDFEVSYEDKDGDKTILDATKLGIEDFLALQGGAKSKAEGRVVHVAYVLDIAREAEI